MKRHRILVATVASYVVLGVACVDLFHSTDFETLCGRSPTDPSCTSPEASAPDAFGETGPTTDASRAHPDFCAWSSAEAQKQAVRACAWLGACERPLGESVFGPCVVRAQLAFDCGANPSLRPAGAADAFWACLATVSSCSEVDQCVFPGGPQDCKAVPSGSFTACATLGPNKGVRVRCGSTTPGRAVGIEPCVMKGETCAAEDDSIASCSGSLGYDMCSSNQCSGSAAVDCTTLGTRMFDQGVDCASQGAGTCVSTDAGAACAPNAGAATCSSDAEPSCTGSVVTSCAGGKEIRVDCDRLNLPCDVSVPVPSYDPAAACIRRSGGDTCTDNDRCSNGRIVQSCGRGALYEADCTSLGLGKCTVDASGHAACDRVP